MSTTESPTILAPLLIISGPSGTGKSTVICQVIEESPHPLRLSVSATTRTPRPGEVDGLAYHFWTREQFDRELAEGAFLEWADVFGHRYGTLKREVEDYRRQGIGVILDVDVQGADQVRQQCPDNVSVFLRTSSLETYEQRLRKRGTETEEAIQRRLAGAQRELAAASRYDYQIINDDLSHAVAQLLALIDELFAKGKACLMN